MKSSFYRHLILLGKDAQWLSKQLGVTHQTVYNWKNGKAKPGPKRLKEISVLLNLPMDKLVREFHG